MREPLSKTYVADLDRVRNEGTLIEGVNAAADTDAAPGSAFTIRWDLLRQALPILLRGALTTLYVTLLTLLFGVPLGLFIALIRLSHFPPLRLVAPV